MSDDRFGDDISKPAVDDALLFSVTTVLKVLGSEGLIYWSAEQAALKAIKLKDSLAVRIKEEGEEAVVKMLRDARFDRGPAGQRTAAELGTAVHGLLQEYALTGRRPDADDEERPYLDQFDQWCQLFQPQYEAAEMTVFSPTFGVAGTLDAIGTVCGARLLIDYKTSRRSHDKQGKPTKPYPEAALQVAAYRHAEKAVPIRPRRFEKYRRRYYLWGSPEQAAAIPMPEVDGGLVLHVTPEHCVAYPVACGPKTYDAFLFVLEASRWMAVHSSSSIGDPLEPPAPTQMKASA